MCRPYIYTNYAQGKKLRKSKNRTHVHVHAPLFKKNIIITYKPYGEGILYPQPEVT